MAKLIDIEGIGPDDAELLEATGWTDAHALAKADPEVLTREITDANAMLKIVARTPERRRVERWIAAATRAVDPEGLAAAARVRRPAASFVEAHADRPRRNPATGAGESRFTAKNGHVATPVVQEEVAPSAAPVEASSSAPAPAAEEDRSGETALAALAGPVNFEADPDVAEMLAVAPFALPIPARQLAERGIAPSEIAVAPLLNRALGDLEVRVTVEKPERKNLPDAPASSRLATSSVQVSDAGFSMGRRGFDSTKIRTIEEAQGDAPPVRASSSPAGMQDERINLLRSPLEKTNRGRKPSSRFYIRGVLHDRPLKVWFGGLFLVLLQLVIPLAIIAAPLLILSDQQPEEFAWVPAWIIAFPLAVPVLGILYAFVSTGAKCRVCAQRMYVPKHCLKNRKAHHLPLLGYIGAVALHVMTFKWYNCTFCGTSIRIKK
ncbi:DUF4332 domain-containing protein [Luteolibacter arcticus]|uniref:DUF4332 domain-containing protein n=1 Tax=Luteolibacter arcticus TaxID=1581411 RepID=A0ABT3GH64_9BACT|nr:DUF4332 domain-containing protein [Luteolibacter arcticus]MCW1922961.1 DUF4332 domain-containing protein [Luteolibacter arcticus]